MRALAPPLVVVALLAQVASFAHLVAVRHVRCAEHGELIEVHGEAVVAAAARVGSDELGDAGQTHGHDHCLLLPLRRDRAAPGTPPAGRAQPAVTRGPVAAVTRHEATPPIALLRFAPKSSPPPV